MTARTLLLGAFLALGVPGPRLAAQRPDPRGDAAALASYYRAVGEHFRVPANEIAILSGWRLPPEEIPVVLWVAGRAGISRDAVVALRQAGRDWSDVAARYGIDASALHVPLEGNAGSLAQAYEAYRSRPPSQWSQVRLDDGEIVGLVNLRTLGEILSVPLAALLQARDRTGSWVDAYRTLSRR